MPKRKLEDLIEDERKKMRTGLISSLILKHLEKHNSNVVSDYISSLTINSPITSFNVLFNTTLKRLTLFKTNLTELKTDFPPQLSTLILKNNTKLTTMESNFNFIKYLTISDTPINRLDKFYIKYVQHLIIKNGDLNTVNYNTFFGKNIKRIEINNNKKFINMNTMIFDKPLQSIDFDCNCLNQNQYHILKNVKFNTFNHNINWVNLIFTNSSYMTMLYIQVNNSFYNINILKKFVHISHYLDQHNLAYNYRIKVKTLQELCSQKLILMNKEKINDTDENGNLTVPQEVKNMYNNYSFSTITCQNGDCNNSITVKYAYKVLSYAVVRQGIPISRKAMFIYQLNCHKCINKFTPIKFIKKNNLL